MVRPWSRMRFVHSRRLHKVEGHQDREWPHQVYEVTKVTAAGAYYREPGQRAPGWFVKADEFPGAVLEILADYPDQTEPCTVADLRDGDVFSADQGQTWHTCAVAGFGTVSVYADLRRDEDAPTGRIALALRA